MKAKLRKLAGDFGRLLLAELDPDPLADDLRHVVEGGRLGAEQDKQGLGAKLAVGFPFGHVDTRARVAAAVAAAAGCPCPHHRFAGLDREPLQLFVLICVCFHNLFFTELPSCPLALH